MIKQILVASLIGSSLLGPSSFAHQAPDVPAKLNNWYAMEHKTIFNKDETITVEGVKFSTSISGGLARASLENKPLLVFMKKASCPHCVAFERSIISNDAVKKFLTRNFTCCRVLSDSPEIKALEKDFGCYAYPHYILFSNKGRLIGKWFGLPKSPDAFISDAKNVLNKNVQIGTSVSVD